jgi:nucleoside-diphosphate kinase
MADQATLVIIKPDGLKKSLTGNILTRLSETKLKIVGAKLVRVSRQLAEKHYAHLTKKPFFEELVRYITGELHGDNRVLALVYWGENAIDKIHDLAGATNPEQAIPTTIRGQYGRILTSGVFENVIHTSSEPEEAEREIKLWFEPHDIVLNLYPVREELTPERKVIVWA